MRVLALPFLILAQSFGQDSFNPNEYPSNEFRVTRRSYEHDLVQIELIQVKRTSDPTAVPFYCRAWLNVLKNGEIMSQRYFSDFDPVGGSFGLFVPDKPYLGEFFAIVKQGDYDGQLLLIDKQGAITQHLGGAIVLSRDHKLLFSIYYTDGAGLEVVDLTNGKSLFSDMSVAEPVQWYFINDHYFFKAANDSIYAWDSPSRRLQTSTIDKAQMESAIKLQLDFSPQDKSDCTCQN